MTRAEKWAKWSALVSEQAASGKNMAEWCREKRVGYTLFLYWKNQLDNKKPKKYAIALDFGNGLRLDAAPGFDEKVLCRIILALQNACPRLGPSENKKESEFSFVNQKTFCQECGM